MTVPIQDPIVSYTGNGIATQYTVPFRVLVAADLVVLLSGVAVTTGFTVTGLGDDEATVTFSVAPANGQSILMYRDVALERANDYQFNGDLRAATVNADFDRIWMALQDTAGTANRSLHFPLTEYGLSSQLPPAASRASRALVFDASGNAAVSGEPFLEGSEIIDEARDVAESLIAGITIPTFQSYSPTLLKDGIDYTSGTSVSVTLPPTSVAKTITGVFFDGVFQSSSQWSLSGPNGGTTLTFLSTIPSGIAEINVTYFSPSLLGQFYQDGFGVVPRTFQSKMRDVVSVTDWGATQALDASAAFILAAQACHVKGGGKVFIPAGTWSIGAPVPQYSNVEFVGDGKGVTILQPTTAVALFSLVNPTETISYVAVRDLTISPSVAGVKGIQWTLCRFTEIEDVDFIGCTGGNFVIDRGLGHTVANVNSAGKTGLAAGGASMYSSVDNDYVFHATVSNYKLVNQGTGSPSTGLYMRRAIDFQVTDFHAYGADGCTILVVENDSQAVKVKGLNVDGCAAGVLLQQGSGVAAIPTFTSIANSHIDQPTAFGVELNGAQDTTLDDVMFTPRSGYTSIPALYLSGDLRTKVNGCKMYSFSGSPAGAGIQLSNTSDLTVRNTDFPGCYIGVGFSGTCQNIDIEANFNTCANPIGGSPVGTGNRIRPNSKGFVPGTSFVPNSPAMPASGVPFTNNTAFSCRVFLSGGTFTAVAINGISMSASGSWSGEIQPGETIAITYSSAPAWTWVGK